MENTFFGVPVDTDSTNSITMGGLSIQTSPNAVFQLDQLNLENQKQKLAGFSGPTPCHGEQFDVLQTDFRVTGRAMASYSDALVTSLERSAMREMLSGGSNCAAIDEFQKQPLAGAPISGVALASLLAARSDLQENLNNMAISVPSDCLPDASKAHLLDDYYNVPNSSFGFTLSHECDEVFGNIYSKGDPDTISAPINLSAGTPMGAAFQSYLAIGNVEANSWISSVDTNASIGNHCHSGRFSNELSLRLATSQPTVINSSSIPDQCSEIECPGVPWPFWKGRRLSSEQISCKSKEISLRCGSSGHGQISQTIVGFGYFQVMQEILSQMESYSLENLDQMRYSTFGMKAGANDQFSLSYPTGGGTVLLGYDESLDGVHRFENEMDPALRKRALEAKKKQLLTLLEVVDERYNQCLDEIHTVISAFHAATELDPQIHTRFALQTLTFLYRSLRERISNQILAMSAHFDGSFTRETGESSDTSYFQKQWTLQQLKKKDHQLWRPQRGLPERSVSVLRAWMFQNFLHPYPKDSEKHLLAIKSGLTRSQVSNWFINARVRLWKPLIEEMYAEMNRRKALHKEERGNSSQGSHITIGNRRFNMNQS